MYNQNKYRARRARKFEEEVKDQTEETTTEEVVEEESTPDSHEQFVNILTEMGLSADQAEAVHQMAMDLVNAGGKQEETTQTEMSRARRRRAMARRRANMSRRPARGQRSEFSGRRPVRGEVRGRRDFGTTDNRTQMMLRRQRREIMELKRQLKEFGAQPAARPERTRGEFNTQPKAMSTQGNVLDRVKSFMSK